MDEKTKEFIRKAKSMKKHIGKYDYSKTVYVNVKEKVIITCKIHGDFLQTPSDHLCGCGCSKCSGYYVYSNAEFIEKCKQKHGDTYDYSKTMFDKAKKKVIIICKKHGQFLQTACDHLGGRGCMKCGREITELHRAYSLDEILKKFNNTHGNIYDYSLINNYSSAKEKVPIVCKTHGVFWQSPESHFSGKGCPKCKNSHGEMNISKYLDKNSIKYIQNKSFDGCIFKNKLRFDFYLPDYNLSIEFDGRQHFIPISRFGGVDAYNVNKMRDTIKNTFCVNNIGLIRIRYDEINKIPEILTECITHGIRYRGLSIETCQSVANI